MAFKLFGKQEEPEEYSEEERYVEVSTTEPDRPPMGGVGIKIERLNDFGDTDRILKEIRKGQIVFLKIKGLKDKDMGELKRAVEKLKKIVSANNGDIAGVEQDWLILTPQFVALEKD